MKFEERKINLFNVGKEYSFAQCLSSDYDLGAGIAVDFSKKFHLKSKLRQIGTNVYPDCIYIDGVFNLITKKKYWNKPTYINLQKSLCIMKEKAIELNIVKIAMPKIGCGRDRLQWPKVREIIQDVFQNTDIEILICNL